LITLSDLVFSDFFDGVSVGEEDRSAAVLLKSEVVEDLFLVFVSFFSTLLELFPLVAYDLATGHTSDGYLH